MDRQKVSAFMPNIQVLDPHVADLIAAGEVVERPASVAKELVENAIDAGASAVTVEIERGGMTYLRVTDDGRGIPAGELKTAFLRHATSKLRSEYDLEAIGTLGFRGEALAAIAAVSRMEALTRTAEAGLGASLALEGGVPGAVEEAGCPLGTTMVVRDLFYNTPARLKFMKKDAAEGAAVFAMVQREALSHPEVSVKFIRDGKQELLTPGDGQLQSAVYAVLGRELALGLRAVRAQGEETAVEGFVSMPACCRGSRSWQFFFVNGRQVKSPLLTAALEEAYKNQKMVGRFPACVLHLTTKLNAVDVNVHPAKTEVKFGAERQVFSGVYHAVLSALEGDGSRPALELQGQRKPVPAAPREELARAQAVQAARTGSAPISQARPARTVPPGPPGVVRVHDVSDPAGAVRAHDSADKPLKTADVSPGQLPQSRSVRQLPQRGSLEGSAQKPPAEREVAPPKAVTEGVSPSLLPPEPGWRLAGEVLNTYIIVEQGEKIFFIDKHAAHERMNFDRMKAEGYAPMAQTLLTPAVCRLAPDERAVLLANLPLLSEFGFDADELGDALAVRQAPDYVDAGEISATLEELARELLTTGGADPAAARDALLRTMACKAAIKGGWTTSPRELERVAGEVMSGRVKYCPHGRPVAIELTRKDLEKQFKRA